MINNKISFIDQCATMMISGNITSVATVNNQSITVPFPMVLYNCYLKSDSDIEYFNKEKTSQNVLDLFNEQIISTDFLIIRMKDIKQIKITTALLAAYSKKDNLKFPPIIILCDKDQREALNACLNNFPATIAGVVTRENSQPGMLLDTELIHLIEKNNEMNSIFKKYNYLQATSLTQSAVLFFNAHPLMTVAVSTVTVLAVNVLRS